MPEVFDLGCLTNIRRNQELISVQTKNLFNSVLLSLIDRDVDHMILSKSFDDPELYFSPPPSPLTHMMSEPQPLSSDSLPSPPPITSTSTSAIIQSDDNPVQYRPYHLQNPWTTIIDLSTNEDHPKKVIIQEKNPLEKKIIQKQASLQTLL